MPLLFIRVFVLLLTTASWWASSLTSAAAITLYTDRAAFLAAAGPTSAQDFASSADWFVSKDFGDFSATALWGDTRQTRLKVKNGKLAIDQNFTQAPPLFDLTFASGILALGFDYWNTDPSGDVAEIEIAGQRFGIGQPSGSGFFGAVWNAPLTTFRFYDNEGGGTNLAYVQFDNLAHSPIFAEAPPPPAPTHAPLPAGIWLLGAALLSLGALRGLRARAA